MNVDDDRNFRAFVAALEADSAAVRIKSIRDRPLVPGGRAHVTLFERASNGEGIEDRPHPRFHIEFPPATDPRPPGPLFAPRQPPRSIDALAEQVSEALSEHADVLAGKDLTAAEAPRGSERYFRNSIRVQRLAGVFAEVRAHLASWLDGNAAAFEADAAYHRVRELEDEAYGGEVVFDDADTGTYHSYGHDAPFVHYLEVLLRSLPVEGSEAFAILPTTAQESIRRQRKHTQAHLDWLMRHKYAYQVIDETDIERTLGGLLVDRETRVIASEVADPGSLVPRYELLRIAPRSRHAHAGAWIYRDAKGGLHLQDGTSIEVEERLVRSAKREPEDLTFQRAPGDPRLRPGLRFDWDGNGYVQRGRIEWVSWAGHCDIKAVEEQLGITLTERPAPAVHEYRSDTDATEIYDRDLLLEMVSSVLELGSWYARLDGTGGVSRGVHHFGGARNDSRPDRLQFRGRRSGSSFRWPTSGREDAFVVTGITWPDGDEADLATVFFRHLPDLERVDFTPNPRYLETVEGDYNIIDVSEARISARVLVDDVDPDTGDLVTRKEKTEIDLSDGAVGPHAGRFLLGTVIDDAARRRIARVYWDPAHNEIVLDLVQFVPRNGRFEAEPLPGESRRLSVAAPPVVTLSREMSRDDPGQYRALLDLAFREGKNICADTDEDAPVWNGVVTRLTSKKIASNPETGVERWRVDVVARFGRASLDFLLRRGADGTPVAYSPAGARSTQSWVDFFWHDVPDVGSKGLIDGDWVVNHAMLEREIVEVAIDRSVASGYYVHDDHIKNTFEIIYSGLAGHRYTIVHQNKRYGFENEAAWTSAVERLRNLRSALKFTR